MKWSALAAAMAGAVALASPLAAQKTDVIILTNGDRLTGQVKGVSAGSLEMSPVYVNGTISVQWTSVARFESDKLFIVEMEDGSVYTGTLAVTETPPGESLRLKLTRVTGAVVIVDTKRVIGMAQTSDHFWGRFNGTVNSGFIFSKGNQSTQYNLSSTIQYPRARWGVQGSFNSSLSSSSGSDVSTRNQVGLGGRHLMKTAQWFYSSAVSFLQSEEQGITGQTSLGVGIGRYLARSDRSNLAVIAGVGWQGTKYDQAVGTQADQDLALWMLVADLNVYRWNKTSLSITADIFPAIGDLSHVYFGTNATYYLKFLGNLTWNVSFYGNWDTQPPPGFAASDYGLSSGLGWTFGDW